MAYQLDESLRLKRMAKLAQECIRVLDIGYSQQPNPYLNNKEVIGVDLNASYYPNNYTGAVCGDAIRLDTLFMLGSIDAVIVGEFIEHIESPIDFLRNIHRILRGGGMLVLSTPNPNSPIERLLTLSLNRRFFYTKEHICLYPQRWLIRIIERAGFEDVKLYSGGFPIPGIGLVPFPRAFCYQTIAVAIKSK